MKKRLQIKNIGIKIFSTLLFMICTLPIAFSDIYINEISGNDKWLELYNSGDTEVNLAGYTIRKIDENGETADFYIKSGTIAPGGFMSWERDKDCTDGSTFTWGISAKKDVAFRLFDTEPKEIDYFEVRSDLYSEGLSRTVGRETDGAEKLVIFKNGGTRDASNNDGIKQEETQTPKKLYINEINGNKYNKAGEDQKKWLEIYNAENEPVDLTGYCIQKIDEKGSTDNWFISEGQSIPAGGFGVWEQDSLCKDNSTFTWGISAKKNVSFKIFDDNWTELDYFVVIAQPETEKLYSEGEGRTVGRKYDGDSELVVFENNGTKGASNGKKTTGPEEPEIPNNTEIVISNTPELSAYVNSNILYLSEDIKSIMLVSVSGKIVLSQDQSVENEINLTHLPKSVYLLKMQGENNKVKTQKIYIR